MADENKPKFACEGCGKQYTWKPELAGKKAKCKCGATMTVPQQRPAGPEDDAGMYDLAEDPQDKKPASAGSACPVCSSPLAAGAVLCVACGYNLKTGKRMGTAMEADAAPALPAGVTAAKPRPAGAATAAAPAATSPRPGVNPFGAPRQRGPVEKDSGKGKMIATLVVVAVLLGGLAWVATSLRGPKDNFPPAQAGEDTEILAAMRRNGTEEAAKFLESSARNLGNWTQSRGQSFVKGLYNDGAREVRTYSNGLISRSVIVILPDDVEARKRLIGYQNRREEEAGVAQANQTKDVGQRYLEIDVGM